MASSGSTKKRRGSSTDGAAEPLIPLRRKLEVLGLTGMALAVLLALAFLTYAPADNAIAAEVNLPSALLNPGETPALSRVQNALGLVGAELARALVPGFLGYTILLPTGLLFAWGYAVFRRLDVRRLSYLSVLLLVAAFVGAALIGWFGHALDASLTPWAGALGEGVAGWMQRVLGPAGSLIVLVLAAAVLALLSVDHDVQQALDRLARAARALRATLRRWSAHGSKRIAELWRERAQERADRKPAPVSPAAEPSSGADPDRSSPDRSSPSSAGSASPPKPRAPEDSPGRGDTEPQSPAPVVDLPPSEEGLSVRRNDLFRPGGSAPRPPKTRSASDAPSSSSPAPSSADAAPSSSSSEPNSSPEPSPSDGGAPPAPDTAKASPSNGTEAGNATGAEGDSADEPGAEDVSLTVQEQVEEERADNLDRAAGPKEIEYAPPPIDLLDPPAPSDRSVDRDELEENKQILLDKLETYDVEIQEINAVIGPTVTRYELTPAPGIKVSRIKSLEDDLAMAMAAQGIRMIAPIPGKSAVGVEIPNRNRELVRLRDVIGTARFRDSDMHLPLPLGKTIEGEVFLADLTKMPHLLIAGATGSGKSVGLNALITGLLYACPPSDLNFVIIDPKKIELQQYRALAEHFIARPEDLDDAVITDIDEALGVLKSCEKEMTKRYDLLSEARVRGIRAYNRKFERGDLDPQDGHRYMPYIVVVVDELADLMMTAGKEIEGPIARLAQMARAVGIHLVLATQRPSVDVITGLIKANFPSRIAFEVASRVDSRTILDQIGAEGLVGNGDMLFQSGSTMVRLQGPFVSVEEVDRIVDFIADQESLGPYELPSLEDAGHGPDVTLGVEDTDELFEEGARVIVRRQQGSVSLLQRKLAVGYTRAARIVDQLEEAGIVGPFNGTKAREVLVDDEEQLERLLAGEDDETPADGETPADDENNASASDD